MPLIIVIEYFKDILNKWVNIKLLIHFKTDGILDMYFNEEKVIENQSLTFVIPHIKLNIQTW